MKLTILMPVFNEKPHLAEVFTRVVAALARSPLTGRRILAVEFICIDDDSTDGSREILDGWTSTFQTEYGAKLSIPCEYKLLRHEKNQGKGAAIRYGMNHSTGDIVLIQDADLEYNPNDYDALLTPLIKNEADAVYGSRFLGGAKARWLSFIQMFANLFLTWFFNFMSKTKVSDVETCYKVMKGSIARSLRLSSNRFGIELELTARLSRIGARIREVPISYNPRTVAEGKKIGPADGVAALFHIIRYNVLDTRPYKRDRALDAFPVRPRLRTIALLVFATGLVVRLAFVSQWLRTPYAGAPLLDALAYDAWAQEILSGKFLRDTAFYQSPLYPYFLSLLYKVFGHEFLVVSCVQAFLGALTCGILAWFTAKHFGEFAGVAAGILAIFYRPLIFYTAPAMKETLSIFLLSVFLFFVANAFSQNRKREFFAAGLFLGLSALTRGNVLIMAPVVVLASVVKWRRAAILPALVFSVGTALAVSPAPIHNYIASRDFVLLNYTSGFNFYMGNSEITTGANRYPPEISSEPGQEEQDVTRVAEKELGRKLLPSEVSDYWFQKGVAFALANPMQQLASVLNKAIFFWNDYEQPDNYDVTFVAEKMGTFLGWPLVSFGILSVLAAFGLSSSWLDPRRPSVTPFLFFMGFAYAGSILLYYVTDRYRLPIVVFLFPFAGAAFTRAWTLMRTRRFGILTVSSLMVTPFAVVGFWNVAGDRTDLEAFDWGVVASAYSDQKKDHEAVDAFKKGYDLRARAVDAEAYIKTSTSFERMGNLDQAERLLQTATEIHASDALTHYNYGRFKYEHGDLTTALNLFEKAIAISPWLHLPYLGQSLSLMGLGKFELAIQAARKGLSIAPTSPELNTALRLLETRLPAASTQ